MIQESRESSYYDVLDVRKNATPEAIREAYVRAKNAFGHDSLATYSLFDKSHSKRILEEIEVAYNVLSDPDKRRSYDHSHGFIRSIESMAKSTVIMEFGEEVSEIGMEALPRATTSTNLAMVQNIEVPAEKAKTIGSTSETSSNFMQKYLANDVPYSSLSTNAHHIPKKYESDPDMEGLLKNAEAVDGAFLRNAREYKRITLDEMMEFTKLSRKYLEAIEQDAVEKLPAPVYVRGFILQYAKALQLEMNRVASSYMRNFQNLREARGIR